jgi:hypothetical protein
MAIACLPLLPVFGCLEAGSITEILAFGTPHLIRGAIRVHLGEENAIFVIVEKISANSKVENSVEPRGRRRRRQRDATGKINRTAGRKKNLSRAWITFHKMKNTVVRFSRRH